MKCPRCQHENEASAKFCEEYAAPLARTCANCGRQLPATAKFCPECAHPAGSAPAAPTSQRVTLPETYTPHCYFGLGKLYRRTDKRQEAQEHFTTATTMYREMDMRYWLERAEAEMRELA